jgi:hypothetical protein
MMHVTTVPSPPGCDGGGFQFGMERRSRELIHFVRGWAGGEVSAKAGAP